MLLGKLLSIRKKNSRSSVVRLSLPYLRLAAKLINIIEKQEAIY